VLSGIIAITAIVTTPSKPEIIYEPTYACDIFTSSEAKELLGKDAISTNKTEPLQYENVSVSSCGYAQNTLDGSTMRVAAITVRSGINDTGVAQNKDEFTKSYSRSNVEVIEGIGDKAFYAPERGQLNILKERNWIVLSHGVGAAPHANTKEDLLLLASKVISLPPGV